MAEKPELSFESALKELEILVVSLEKGDLSLDDSIKAYERGVFLKDYCFKKLSEARMSIKKLDGVSSQEEVDT